MLDPVELFPEVPNLFEFPSVHADMILDSRRVGAYKRALDATVKNGDVVVDVGTGTGLLSFLALQAGAARVHAIERSAVIDWAKQLAQKNDFAERIVFHNEDARHVDIGEKADVVVSELIGHLAFEEGMVETLCTVKNRFLKPSGVLIPKSVTLHAALANERGVYDRYVDSWKTIWGIDFSFMRDMASQSAYVTEIRERDLFSVSQEVMTVDFSENTPEVVRCTRHFNILRNGMVNGAGLWFDASLTHEVNLSSGPWTKTHWRQCFVPFERPIPVEANSLLNIDFELKFRRDKDDKFIFSAKPWR